MAKLYRVELESLKSWRSGNKRFVLGYPQYLPEAEAKSFMNDRHFRVMPLESKEQEAELVKKGVIKASPQGEQPRLASQPKEDQKREDLSASLKVKAKMKAKPESEEEA